jgi:hypothetical protein
VTEETKPKKAKKLAYFKLVRQETDAIDRHIRFDQDLSPMCCREKCQHFDGKRCGRTGEEPDALCRPVVGKLVKLCCSLDHVLFEDP